MKIIDAVGKSIEINNREWVLAEDLFIKWGMVPNQDNEISVIDVDDVAPELSAWGIPWRRTEWPS